MKSHLNAKADYLLQLAAGHIVSRWRVHRCRDQPVVSVSGGRFQPQRGNHRQSAASERDCVKGTFRDFGC